MPARKATELTDLIKKLRTIRRQHEQALGEIESTFRQFGIEHLLDAPRGRAAAGGKRKPGPKPKAQRGKPGPKPKAQRGKPGPKAGRKKAGAAAKAATKKGKRVRGTYAQTGDEFIIAFLAKKGSATTQEIRQHWQKAGRRGKAENNLTGLVKSGKVLRAPTPGEAGSTYSLPAGAATPTNG